MSGLFVTDAPASDPTLRPVERPPSWLEAAGASWRLAKDDDEAENYGNKIAAYNALEDGLVALGNPREKYNRPEWRSFWDTPETAPQRLDTLWRDVEAARARDPRHFADVPKTRAEFERWGYGRQGERAKDLAIASRGGVGTSILPNLGFGVLTLGQPQNLPYLAIGGGSPTISGLMAREFLTNSIGAAANAPTIARSRANMGEAYDDADRDVLLAGATGALFAGGLHAGGKLIDHFTASDRAIVDAFDEAVPADLRTPDERAAIHVIERQADIDAANPYVPGPAGMDAHAQQLQATIENILSAGEGRAAPAIMRAAVIDRDGVKARIAQAESGGSYTADNPQPGQSAFGKYQFIDSTWKAIGKRLDPGASDAQIMAMRADPAAQERFMDAALAEYQATYARAGITATPGDLYLMHALGPKAVKIARADPSTPIAELVSPAELAANPTWLKGTAGDVRAEFARRTGGDPAQRLISGPSFEGENLKADIAPERPPIVVPPVREELATFDPSPLLDEFRSYVRQGKRPLTREAIADHFNIESDQADRLLGYAASAPDTGVMIGRDGTMRRRPVRRGPVDLITYLADNGGIADNEGHGLVNGRNLQQFVPGAGPLIRKGGRSIDEVGELLFERGWFPNESERPTTAQVLELIERAKREKAFRPEAALAADDARRKEISDAAEQAAHDEIRALIGDKPDNWTEAHQAFAVDRMAMGATAEQAIMAAHDDHALNTLRALAVETDDAAYDIPGFDDNADFIPTGRDPFAGDDAGDDRSVAPRRAGSTGEPRDAGPGQDRAGERRGAPDSLAAFDDPAGAGAKAVADSLEHDLKAELLTDPAIADRQRQEAALRAKAPLRKPVEQDGTMGAPLFDAADQPTFRLAEGDERPIADIFAEIDADEAAIKAAKDCL